MPDSTTPVVELEQQADALPPEESQMPTPPRTLREHLHRVRSAIYWRTVLVLSVFLIMFTILVVNLVSN